MLSERLKNNNTDLFNNINFKTTEDGIKLITIKQAINIMPNLLYHDGKERSTIDCYMRDYNHFNIFMKHNYSSVRYVKDITYNEIFQLERLFITLIKDGTIVINTAKRKINAIRTMFRLLTKYNFVKQNIMFGDEFGNKNFSTNDTKKKLLPKIPPDSEIKKLIASIDDIKNRNSLRDLAIISLLLYTGCRRSDVINLNWSDVDFIDDKIRFFRNKNDEENWLPMHENLKKNLLNYMHSLGNNISIFTFASRQKNRISTTAFNTMFNKYVKLSGIRTKDCKVTPHTLRHYFITTMVKNGVSLLKIMRYTGHRDIETLKVYTKLNVEDLREDLKYLPS